VPVSDQVRPIESSKPAAASGFHAELHSIWGPPPALTQAGQFLTGVGEGFGQAVNEGAKAAVQAVSNPGEALHKAATETGKAVVGVLTATEKAGEYIGDHAARGDMKGVMQDAKNTSHVIDHILSAGIERLSKMNAHDLGKVVGHDVLPGAIVAVAAPELAGESIALAASAASKMGTVVKEGAAIEKVAGAYEAATSKIASISEKIAGLNRKMEAFQNDVRCTRKLDGEGFENFKPIPEDISPPSEAHKAFVKECEQKLEPWVKKHLDDKGIEIHPVRRISDLPQLGKNRERLPACTVTNGDDKGIYIAEEVFHKGRWDNHHPVDILFNMFHEAGHAINATLRTDNLSNSTEFGKLFEACWAKIDKTNDAAKAVGDIGTRDRMQDEIMADMWGHLHATPHPDNTYSNTLRQLFAPIYDHMKDWRLQ
jgi:hypothetical protein